jgi:hypothetical protein
MSAKRSSRNFMRRGSMNKIKADEIIEEIYDTLGYLRCYVGDDQKAKKEAEEEAKKGVWDADVEYEKTMCDKCDDDVIGMYEFFDRLEKIYIKDIKPVLKECRKDTYIPEAIRMIKEAKK